MHSLIVYCSGHRWWAVTSSTTKNIFHQAEQFISVQGWVPPSYSLLVEEDLLRNTITARKPRFKGQGQETSKCSKLNLNLKASDTSFMGQRGGAANLRILPRHNMFNSSNAKQWEKPGIVTGQRATFESGQGRRNPRCCPRRPRPSNPWRTLRCRTWTPAWQAWG